MGSTYYWKVEHVGCAGCGPVQGLLYYGGLWYVLEQNQTQKCRSAGGNPNCRWEVYLEPYTDTNNHWDIGGNAYDGNGTTLFEIMFRRISNNTYELWEHTTHGSAPGEIAPYEYCGYEGVEWHRFRARKDANCPGP